MLEHAGNDAATQSNKNQKQGPGKRQQQAAEAKQKLGSIRMALAQRSEVL